MTEKMKNIMDGLTKFVRPYQITRGKHFHLDDHDPADTGGLKSDSKDEAQKLLGRGLELLKDLQEKLYAQNRWGVVLIFQAMDAAGKDSTIKHVMSGVDPQGCQVTAFKAPSTEELDHDFLWRAARALPERGRIGIFNRSYYEETLVVRVHRELLERQNLPAEVVTKKIWEHRFEDICAFEKHLARNGYLVLKFFLNVSPKEQKKRFLSRLDDPGKNWKFSQADVSERSHWDEYMHAYQETIRATARPHAPWHVIPADNKWFTRLAVAGAVVDALAGLDLRFPALDPVHKRELTAARDGLLKESSSSKGKGGKKNGDKAKPGEVKAGAATSSG